MLTRTLLVGTILLGLSYGCASTQNAQDAQNAQNQIDPADCEAAKEAFDNYSANLSDPDLDQAKIEAASAAEDCKKGLTNQGGLELLHAMRMMGDGTHTPSRSP
jgi:hypothetical protein